jgi:membrane protease YdiL (CAAX protease family)
MGLGALASASAALLAGVELDTLRRMLESNAALLLAHFVLQVGIVATGEELGWRGWLLPILLKRTSRLRAALAVAGVWGLWHAPLLLSSITTTALFLLGVAGLSILFTWLLIHTNQRLFVVVVAHAAVNTPMFFWEQVAPAVQGAPGSMQAAWYMLEACFAGVALLLVLANWHWWTAGPAEVAEPVAWVAGPGQPAAPS